MTKSSVSALHEFCAKYHLMAPVFDFIEENDSFVCRVMIDDISADGVGRSKRDAKHLASSNIIKKIALVRPEITEIPRVEPAELPTNDTYAALRDFCVQNDYPLPTISIVQQAGTPDAPIFIAECVVASVKRYGQSEKKKDAKQIAAQAVLHSIQHTFVPEAKKQLVHSMDSKAAEIECERRKKFRSYRELTGLKENEYTAVKMTDRHMYFTKYNKDLKDAAMKVLYSDNYDTAEEKAMDVLKSLKLTPFITKNKGLQSMKDFLFIELDCDYDAVFAGYEPDVYHQIVEYFKTMLV